MIKKIKIIRGILKRKNAQLRDERQKYEAERAANLILSAYVAVLAARYGGVRIPKKEISEALGRFFVNASVSGDDYVIEVGEHSSRSFGGGAGFGKTGRV